MNKYVTTRQRQELRKKKFKKIVVTLIVIAIFCTFGAIKNKVNIDRIFGAFSWNKNGSQSIVEENSKSIPDYSGQDYIVLNDGKPCFNRWDFENITGEQYSSLDQLGRCGTAYAMLNVSMMPTEDRGEIGSIKPSGWKQEKYPGYIDSNPPYLYNRCHLIAYALTGQNANDQNLITGTRYMNATTMLPYEMQVMNYLDKSDNHVLYRITPLFRDKELVARGVEMEAFSVEDQGDGVCFHVFVYNIQPGIEIDYQTGESRVYK